MKVEFADSFWKSLKRFSRHQTWWYKTYEVFRYKIPMFCENLWYFRKELWRFRSWDYTFNLQLLKRSLEKTAHTLEYYGQEVDGPRMKKVNKIKRVIELINNIDEGRYISRAETELGELKNSDFWDTNREDTPEESTHNRKVFNRSTEIENEEWEELFSILKGQNHDDYKNLVEKNKTKDDEQRDLWEEWYDGSGIKHWWD